MTSTSPRAAPCEASAPTLWGLSPTQLHDRFWSARGVMVVRRGQPFDLGSAPELYLLADPDLLALFRLRELVEALSWLRPRLVAIRLRDPGERGYREAVSVSDDGTWRGTERIYDGLDSRMARVGITPDAGVARLWERAGSNAEAWRTLRTAIAPERRLARVLRGRVFDASRADQQMALLEALLHAWGQPDSTVPRIRRGPGRSWVDTDASVDRRTTIFGPVWIGAGRRLGARETVQGPAILWDDPARRPRPASVPWSEIEPAALRAAAPVPRPAVGARILGKRVFDILFSLVVLALTLPLYPLIALAILLEDGWPVFFAHRRETLGGREFPCLKFRSMRRDAERIKAAVAAQNVADGPQFFVRRDPRSTRVGRILRATQLDEIPQFWNVLLGHMSVVGPRPSPRSENQFCPAWRDARLSVRPGVTGLWQIRRTRAEGLDFQEWIRYDLEYVRRMTWRLDLWILWRTVGTVLRTLQGK